MLRASLLCLLLVSSSEGRVKFTYSEFLDGSDLKTVSETDFACPHGCMVYSATENVNLVIINKATKQEIANLNALANSNNANDRSNLFGMTLSAATYTLKEKNGFTGTIFGLYVVANNAPNYGQTLRVAEAFDWKTFSSTSGMITMMTRGTGIRMVSTNSDGSKEMTPQVFAAGYDAPTKDECWAVYKANSLSHAQQSQIDVIGPIATIRFDGLQTGTAASVKVSGDIMTDMSEMRNSLTISSPGFHGCFHASANLYQYNMNKLDRRFRSDLDQGVTILVRSKLWITVESDALYISGLQDQTMKLMGTEEYSPPVPFSVNKVDVHLSWQRLNQNSYFAIQMDATKGAATSSLLLSLFASVFALIR